MKTNFLFFFLVSVLGISSCTKETDPSTPPVTSGDISGSVNLYDEGVTQVDNDGMTITVEGTSPLIVDTTDVDGKYKLSNVPYGTYNLVYEKAGYGTFKRFNVEHKNPLTAIPNAPSLGQKSTTEVTDLNLNSSSNFPVILSATTNPGGSQANTRYIKYFFSTDSTVSSTNFAVVLGTFPVNINPFNLNLTQAALDSLGFPSGSVVFARCYGDSFWSNEYDDPNEVNTIYPNINSNAASAVFFIVP